MNHAFLTFKKNIFYVLSSTLLPFLDVTNANKLISFGAGQSLM